MLTRSSRCFNASLVESSSLYSLRGFKGGKPSFLRSSFFSALRSRESRALAFAAYSSLFHVRLKSVSFYVGGVSLFDIIWLLNTYCFSGTVSTHLK